MTPAADRFATKYVKDPSGCWRWTAYTVKGYGYFWSGKRPCLAHRWAYEHFVGPIPADLQLDHLCRNPGCVNPSHLEAVTSRENFVRGFHRSAVQHRQNRCIRGHSLDDAYVFRRSATSVSRQCRHCKQARNKARFQQEAA